jgi:hypothetical protein
MMVAKQRALFSTWPLQHRRQHRRQRWQGVGTDSQRLARCPASSNLFDAAADSFFG